MATSTAGPRQQQEHAFVYGQNDPWSAEPFHLARTPPRHTYRFYRPRNHARTSPSSSPTSGRGTPSPALGGRRPKAVQQTSASEAAGALRQKIDRQTVDAATCARKPPARPRAPHRPVGARGLRPLQAPCAAHWGRAAHLDVQVGRRRQSSRVRASSATSNSGACGCEPSQAVSFTTPCRSLYTQSPATVSGPPPRPGSPGCGGRRLRMQA
nr:hypothetical protein [Streptomyces cinnamoneus]